MQQSKSWFSHFALLVLGLAIGITWSTVGTGQSKSGASEGGRNSAALDMVRVKNAVDIAEIKNLESNYSHSLDSGRLSEVAALYSETGGHGRYYQDPVTSRLHPHGKPLDSKGQPIKDFPGCMAFGRQNIVNFLAGGEPNSVRPHVEGFMFNGKPGRVSRHVILNKWVRVTGDTATLHDYYGAGENSTMGEIDLVRTAAGWKFQLRRVISPKPAPDRTCTIADPKFPIPPNAVPTT